MNRWIVLLGLSLFFLSACGCATYHGLRPITPSVGEPSSPSMVDTLQPVLEWEPAEGAEVTYDVIVFEEIPGGKTYNPGKTVFYREGISGNKVQVEPPLMFDSIYWWSVRVRNGAKVSEWSKYDHNGSYPYFSIIWKNVPYSFRTPYDAGGLR